MHYRPEYNTIHKEINVKEGDKKEADVIMSLNVASLLGIDKLRVLSPQDRTHEPVWGSMGSATISILSVALRNVNQPWCIC
jgi:hypothetical protein